jgi:hypothetical protein
VLGTEPSGHDVIKARNEHEQARERVRLWYVAATRARDLLVLPRHSAKLMRAKIDPDREPIRPGPSCRMFHNTPAPDRTILVQTDYGRVERMNRDRPISAIGADAKELPRQRGALAGLLPAERERSGGWVRPVYSKVYTMAPIRARGEKTGVPRGLA